jgi:hypothetical protein
MKTHDPAEAGDAWAYGRMCAARTEFVACWRVWLASGPSIMAIAEEEAATESVVSQLSQLSRDA